MPGVSKTKVMTVPLEADTEFGVNRRPFLPFPSFPTWIWEGEEVGLRTGPARRRKDVELNVP